MRKSVTYLVWGLTAAAVVAVAVCLLVLPMLRADPEGILAAYQDNGQYGNLTIDYPLDETLFPPEIVPPTFRWTDDNAWSDMWLITIEFPDDQERFNKILKVLNDKGL